MWIIYVPLIFLIIIFSDASINSARNAVDLFIYNVLPSLFPFFILTNLLSAKGKSALVSGFLCGYPAGAIACASLHAQNKIDRRSAEFYSSFINNAGPTFVIGTIGITMCNSIYIGIFLLASHLAASLTVMAIFKLRRNQVHSIALPEIQAADTLKTYPGEQLTYAITSALKQIATVGGYIIFCAVLIGILSEVGLTNAYLFSFLEITTGIKLLIDKLPKNEFLPSLINILPLISFFLGWSGLSIHAQIISILNKAKLRSQFFIFGKILQASLSALYTFLFLKIPAITNYMLEIPAFSQNLPNSGTDILKRNIGISPIFLILETIPILLITAGVIKKRLISQYI